MAEMASLPPCNHLPVTPPADHDSFAKGLFPSPSHPFAQPVYAALNTQARHPPSPPQSKPQSQSQSPQPKPSNLSSPPPPPQPTAQTQPQTTQTQSQPTQTPLPFPPIAGPVAHLYDRAGNPIDPRYVAMASRISAYYQQRCQAIANYQQQRCQQWATLQRQKCQDMMQATMLVVAWYIRDRISRRRRRQKRQFRRGLSRKDVGERARPTKGETVRRWVLGVPDDVVSAGKGQEGGPSDPEEGSFSFDREAEAEADGDTKLYRVADDLIRSQVGKVDVPLLGMVGFDESESESETESEEEEQYEDDDDDDEMEYDEDDDEMEYDEQEGAQSPRGQERMGSQDVQVSSGKNSRKRRRSSCGT